MIEPNSNTTKNMPVHVAIILDGNRRWAASKDKEYIEGHKEALNRIEDIIEYSAQIGIPYLTFWAWSTKNWSRNAEFISNIMDLFRHSLSVGGVFQRALQKGAKLHHIGRLDGFPDDIQRRFKDFISREPDTKRIDVNIAIGYEGRDEIIRAVRKIIQEGAVEETITREMLADNLDTSGQPDVDLVIRTGGDKRTSGFLIWQAADAEFYFTDDYMPDFTVDKYEQALVDFSLRERRMGGDSKKY
jgi:undecaprenyl diphosphate synthase